MRKLLILFLILWATPAVAVTRYAGPSGTASWANCDTQSNPCSLYTTLQNADDGDIVRVLAGSYSRAGTGNVWSAAFSPANSGSAGNLITFEAYPEGASVNLTLSSGRGPVVGFNGSDSYIHLKGFTVTEGTNMLDDAGIVILRGAGNNIIEDFEIIGRHTSSMDNHDGIRVEGTSNNLVTNVYIRGFTGAGWNSAGVKVYQAGSNIFEYITYYNNTCAVFDKRGNHSNNTYRYSLFDRNGLHFKVYTNDNYPTSQGHVVHNNIFLPVNSSLSSGDHFGLQIGSNGNVANIQIYNNVIYDVEYSMGAVYFHNHGPNIDFWNNIFMNISNDLIRVQSGDAGGDLDYVNYNQFYNSSTSNGFQIHNGTAYSLSGWCSNYGYDCNSITTNPNFDNAGGTDAEDYKRSSYPAEGRGGSYHSVIGAYISDTNPSQIGHDFTVGDTTPPVVTSAVINSTGDQITITFNEACSGNNGLSITAEYGLSYMSYYSGSGTQRVYDLSRVILVDETVTLNYSEAAGNILDTSSNEMVGFSLGSVSNGSTVTGATTTKKLRFGSEVVKASGKRWVFE